MKHHYHYILVLVCLLATFSSVVTAQNIAKEEKPLRIIWTQSVNGGTGLYSTRNYFVAPSLSISGFANYYYGDVDNEGLPWSGGFNRCNLKGGVSLMYQHPISRHCNVRAGLTVCALGGDNTTTLKTLRPDGSGVKRDDYKKFQSIVIQPYAGVQYYPFSQIGFYLYGGIGLSGSIITHFDFLRYVKGKSAVENNDHLTNDTTGTTFGFVPMVQMGFGYSWMLSSSWSLSFEFMVQQGLCDEYYGNLDAYPLAAAQYGGKEGENYGTGGFTAAGGHKWADGWIQAGITITYQWSNCETCRIIDNGKKARSRKRR